MQQELRVGLPSDLTSGALTNAVERLHVGGVPDDAIVLFSKARGTGRWSITALWEDAPAAPPPATEPASTPVPEPEPEP